MKILLTIYSQIRLVISCIIALKYDINSNQTLITYANDSICSITGYSKEEILHRPIESLFYMNVDENTLKQLIKSIHLFLYIYLIHYLFEF